MKAEALIARIALSALVAGLAAPASAQRIELFLQPDTSAPSLATVNAADPQFKAGSLVLDTEKAAQGWLWGEYTTTLTGYVSDAKINKQLQPVAGALIHLSPDAASPVLTTVADGDNFEIVDTGAWWTVRFTKSIPVYYRDSGPLPVGMDVEKPAEAPAPATRAPAAPPVMAPAPPVVAATPTPVPQPRADTAPVAKGIAHQFEGTFRKAGRTLLMFEPKFRYEIVNSSGERIAYVDLDQVVLPGPIDGFLDRTVIVSGAWEAIEGDSDIVVRARHLRLKK